MNIVDLLRDGWQLVGVPSLYQCTRSVNVSVLSMPEFPIDQPVKRSK